MTQEVDCIANLEIELTAQDLEGDYSHTRDCPLYRAIKRVEPSLFTVGASHVIFRLGVEFYRVTFPQHILEISREILRENCKPQKFTWKINLPNPNEEK